MNRLFLGKDITFYSHSTFNSLHCTLYPLFDQYLSSASFISIDSEFSGLASQRILRISNIQDRYHFLSKEIKSRSLLEFGVSIFTKVNVEIQKTTSSSSTCSTSLPISSTDIKPPLQEKNHSPETIIQNNNNVKRKYGEFQSEGEEEEDIGSLVVEENNAPNSIDTNGAADTKKEEQGKLPTTKSLVNEYNVVMFTFLMLNTQDFTISPRSLSFLAQHGLDFNRLFLDGIQFTPFSSKMTTAPAVAVNTSPNNNNKKKQNKNTNNNNNNNNIKPNNNHIENTMTDQQNKIISSLTKYSPTLVVHNGLFDLLFIYQSFIGDLPEQLASFISQFLITFPKIERINYKRLKDTQSFVKCVKVEINNNNNNNNSVSPSSHSLNQLSFSYSKPYVGTPICENYSNHGFCKYGDSCSMSHNVNLILDQEESKTNNVKKMKHQHTIDNQEEKEQQDENTAEEIIDSKNSHCAGDDSAMTGFIFCYYLLFYNNEHSKHKLSEIENKVYISGKQIPLVMKKSNYA
ncbi:hypothetical protein DFA_02494 [Cavenderia fasciculata]|uniref:C3H1-type domain-containing protein n=1 Tax=Cavenderia fasciculata TaxID=261658 RepID=F4Q075_CACFS|nr:uncharacterized protein DFA_02494 [Cavenderia fasciculata]EGG18755.1 hypothetical protein DFA_02494 [Cavenderia fasciculata]|eukprot:XP_004357217.1 hypothetical protein DFA_02494 [Cavenderia fasciculata]